MTDTTKTPFYALDPDHILDAVEATGLCPDGRLLALNSYENRVYQVGLENERFVVVKFYRPGRWSDAAILEEHAFVQALAEAEIPAVVPLTLRGETLHHHAGHRLAVFAREGGHAPPLDQPGTLVSLGRYLGRIHGVGRVARFAHRPTLDARTFGREPLAILRAYQEIPDDLAIRYFEVADEAVSRVERALAPWREDATLRLHGDCHAGNVLWTDHGAHFVDFDDARMGLAIQDLWMLAAGDAEESERQLSLLLSGYSEFADFDPRERRLVEPLRTLRFIHYAAWLAVRWEDPAFPRAFPWFSTRTYWIERIAELEAQVEAMDEASTTAS